MRRATHRASIQATADGRHGPRASRAVYHRDDVPSRAAAPSDHPEGGRSTTGAGCPGRAGRGVDEPDCLRAPTADHGPDAGARPRPGRALQRRPDAEGHLPGDQPAGPVHPPRLRGPRPEADGRADHQRLRALPPVRQQRGARRVEVDPGHGDAQGLLPGRDQNMAEATAQTVAFCNKALGGDAGLGAAAAHHPARRGEPAGRLPRLREQGAHGGGAPGPGPVPGPADVLGPGGDRLAAALRRQYPVDRGQRRPGPAPLLQPLTPGRRRRDRPRQLRRPVGQRDDQGPARDGADQRDGPRPAGAAQRPAEARRERLHPGRWHRGRRDRRPGRLRAGRRPEVGLPAGGQARRRLDAERRRLDQAEPGAVPGGDARRRVGHLRVRRVADRLPGHRERGGRGGVGGRPLDGA